jgi:hypothetical protein
VSNFYRNLQGQHEHVTKDVWMTRTFRRLLRTLGAAKIKAPTPEEGRQIDEAVKKTAAALNTTPAKLQSLLWYDEKRLYRIFGAKSPEGEDFGTATKDAINKHFPGIGE